MSVADSLHPYLLALLPQVYELLADESHAVRHAVAELVAAMLERQGTALLAQVRRVLAGMQEEMQGQMPGRLPF